MGKSRSSSCMLVSGAASALCLLFAGCTIEGSHTDGLSAETGVAVSGPADEGSIRCAGLAGLELSSGSVRSARMFPAGSSIVGGVTDGAVVTSDICRAELRLRSGPGSDIQTEIWMPADWNLRLLAFGGAGFDGSLSPGVAPMLNEAAGKGYAAMATDAGHVAGAPAEEWAYNQPEKIADFGHRGQYLSAIAAREVIEAHYGVQPEKAYFQGCSNGGRDGIMLASRYPDTYDAIVAGAPAIGYIEILTQLMWHDWIVRGASPVPDLEGKLGLLHEAVMAACDEKDGLRDGLLENPAQCKFDPVELTCRGEDSMQCLTQAEADAVRSIYEGPRLSDGTTIVPGPARGSEGAEDNWSAWVTGEVPGIAAREFYRWIVHGNPEWGADEFNFDTDYAFALERVGDVINAGDPDLRHFADRGGKLLIYQGWDDPAITPASTIGYFEAVQETLGAELGQQVKLFMVPGMTHCAGGSGATRFDALGVLEDWVENEQVPARFIASGVRPGSEEVFTRPLCAWPETARYSGSGSDMDAESFECGLHSTPGPSEERGR